MKIFTSLLIGVSLALAGVAFAQQPEEQATPGAGKKGAEKTHATETKSGANLAKPEATAKETGAKKERGASKVPKTDTATETGVSGQAGAGGQPTASAAPGAKHLGHEKGMKAGGVNAKTSPSATPVTAASASAAPVTAASATAAPSASAAPSVAASASAAPSVGASASAAPSVGVSGQQTTSGNAAIKADPQKVQQVKAQAQQIKQQHMNFRAQPRPDRVPAVTFNVNYRIQGSDRWQGPQYEVFRSYHPERHDRGWYSSRYQRVELISGGYYYWNNGYWYPAWGYDPGAEYYAYDAPIYVGHRAEPPDRVIADVQAELQQMGYYRGEVDGLLGPLTREALIAYQADQGLMQTAVIDEPTLNSLNMG